jgi:membrane-bound lytic murein transglycosylase A
VALDDGSRVRIGYADQNGHPNRSIGRWLIDKGELQSHQASMQGIKAWAAANPERLRELLDANPSLVFFRELPATGSGPPGALGVPLTPERSIAVDPRHTPLGAPVWLATTRPNTEEPLVRLMLAQDTGGAIRGPVRADFYWGSGAEAGSLAGRMKQRGTTWVLLPRHHEP